MLRERSLRNWFDQFWNGCGIGVVTIQCFSHEYLTKMVIFMNWYDFRCVVVDCEASPSHCGKLWLWPRRVYECFGNNSWFNNNSFTFIDLNIRFDCQALTWQNRCFRRDTTKYGFVAKIRRMFKIFVGI